ncbi:MAG: LLM class flavin-dependent oxidoreductase, partial [Candidatus Binataceae bacterium]
SVETWDFVADHDYQYSFLSFFGYKAGKKVADGYWNVMAKKGKELNPFSLGFAQVVAVSETDEQAERDYAPHMDYFYNRCLHVYPGFADAPGYRTPSTIKAGLTGQISKNASITREGLKWKDFIDDGYVIAGSPATVRDRLREALKTLNCGHLMILQQIGSMPPELVRKSTDLFAREVMPHLRDLWTGFEDKWSPKRLPANEMAVPAPIWSDAPKTNGKTQRPGASEIRSSVK